MAELKAENKNEAYQKFLGALVADGLLIPSGVRGVYARSGKFEDVVDRFESYVSKKGSVLNAEVMHFPPVMSRATYACMDHVHNFPDLLGSLHSFSKGEREHAELLRKFEAKEDWTTELSPTDLMMLPAACYSLYPTAAGTLPASGRTVDLKAFVFRHEPSDDPARMQIFRMHEYIRIGTPEEAMAHRDFWLKNTLEILQSLGLPAQLVVANDPFFGRGGRLRKATQREQVLKHELVVPICSEDSPTAVASCNYHLDSFGAKFKIYSADGNIAHSSCMGFGLERVTLALFKTHGFDLKKWPSETRALLGL